MSKYQEALDRLVEGNYLTNREKKQFANILQELVDKETPKKPKKINAKDNPSVREGSLTYLTGYSYYCPNCNSFLGNSNIQISIYCKHCGQKLDWSGENE